MWHERSERTLRPNMADEETSSKGSSSKTAFKSIMAAVDEARRGVMVDAEVVERL